MTTAAGVTVAVALAVELAADVLVLVLFVTEVVWVTEELMEDETAAGFVVFTEPDDDPFAPVCELLPALAFPVDLSMVKLHFFTSCTSDFPSTIMGVKVI